MEAVSTGPTPTDRASCWSITINNPTAEDLNWKFPPGSGWKIEGQMELGKEGTPHYQGMLQTGQVRFSQVKKHIPRAHIEKCKSKAALKAYVHKEETRVAEVAFHRAFTVFDLMDMVIDKWDDEGFSNYCELYKNKPPADLYSRYSDIIISQLIEEGAAGGIEYVAINPMWRSAWLKFGSAMVKREKNKSNTLVYNANGQEVPHQGAEGTSRQGGEIIDCSTEEASEKAD